MSASVFARPFEILMDIVTSIVSAVGCCFLVSKCLTWTGCYAPTCITPYARVITHEPMIICKGWR